MPNRIEHDASKVENYIPAHETAHGLIGVFEDLADEHREISALMNLVAANVNDSIHRQIYTQLRQQLLAHEIFELEEIFPELAKNEGGRQLAAEHAEDAAEFDSAIRNLDSLDIDGQEWQAAFKVLMDLFERHMEQEEYDYFPEAQQTLGEYETRRIQIHYIAARHAALKQPG